LNEQLRCQRTLNFPFASRLPCSILRRDVARCICGAFLFAVASFSSRWPKPRFPRQWGRYGCRKNQFRRTAERFFPHKIAFAICRQSTASASAKKKLATAKKKSTANAASNITAEVLNKATERQMKIQRPLAAQCSFNILSKIAVYEMLASWETNYFA